jgi:hypothetical protein
MASNPYEEQYLSNPSPGAQDNPYTANETEGPQAGGTANTATQSIPGSTMERQGGLLTEQYAPPRVDSVQRELQDSDTIQGQLKGVLDNNQDLLTRERTRALEGMNSRGLLNSSMAVGEARNAVLDKALQIAEFDASANLKQGLENQSAANSFLGRDQTFGQDMARGQFDTDLGEFTKDNQLNRDEYSAQQEYGRTVGLRNIDYSLGQQEADAELGRDIQMSAQDYAEQAALTDQEYSLRLTESMQDFNESFALSEQDFREAMGEQEYLAWVESGRIEAEKKSGVLGEFASTVRTVWDNPDMTMEQKDARITQAMTLFGNMHSDIGVDFDYLDGYQEGIRYFSQVFGPAVPGGDGQSSF